MATTIQNIELPKKPRAKDTSGNNNHGEIYSGRALEFDGVTDYLTVAANSDLAFGNNDHTLTGWFNTSDISGSGFNYIVAIGNPGAGQQSGIGFQGGGKLFLSVYGTTFQTTPAPIEINTWYRLTMVYTGGSVDTADFYLNGVFVDQKSIAVNALVGKLTIGVNVSGTIDFTGMISDVQVWDKVWSADDVAYDYANPESLALNASGTALTENNLKAWYPMQDGHRGQQSYILDGTTTLGAEEIIDGGFPNGSTAWSEIDGGTIINNEMSLDCGGTTNAYTFQSSSTAFTLGRSYKVTVKVVSNTTGVDLILYPFSNSPYTSVITVGTTTNTYTVYFVANYTSGNGKTFVLRALSSTGTLVIDNISVKPVNDKHPATTVFYGDNELTSRLTAAQISEFDTNLVGNILTFAGNAAGKGCNGDLGGEALERVNNRVFAGSNDWVAYAGGAINVNDAVAEKLQLTTDGDETDQGVKLPIVRVGDGSTTSVVIGQAYRITAKIDDTGTADADARYEFSLGGASAPISALDGAPITGGIDATEQTYYADVVPVDITTSLIFAKTGETNDAATVVTLDDVSVKPITGFLICHKVGDTADNLTQASGVFGFLNTDQGAGRVALPIITVAGRKYRVKGDCTLGVIKLGLSNTILANTTDSPSFGSAISASASGFSDEVTAAGNSMCIYVQNNVTTEDDGVKVDNLTIQEVGVASGWTDADEQSHIPQPALQSYNKMAWFLDSGDNFVQSVGTSLWNGTNGEWNSVSCWVNAAPTLLSDMYWAVVGSQPNLYQVRSGTSNTYDIGYNSGNGDVVGINIAKPLIDNVLNHWVLSWKRNQLAADTDLRTINNDGDVEAADDSNLDYHVQLFLNGVKQVVAYQTGVFSSNGVDTTATNVIRFMSSGSNSLYQTAGLITEMSSWKGQLTTSEVGELYSDRKGFMPNVLAHSNAANLTAYWRNNGLGTWSNLVNPGTADGIPNGLTETILIQQGVDSTRDSQGFVINRPSNTSGLNLAQDGSHVEITDDDTLDFGAGDFTMECWVKYSYNSIGSALNTIMSLGGQALNTTSASINSDSDEFRFYIGDTSHGSSSTLVDGDWYHVVCTRASNTMRLYINSTLEGGTGTSSSQTVTNALIKTIGKDTNTNRYYPNPIDGVQIYNRALSATEVTKNYKATKHNHRN